MVMLFIRLAWRNILRNGRRTALTVAAVGFGVAALVFAWALFDGSNNQSIDNMTGTFTGHVQVHRSGYADDPSLELTFSSEDLDLGRLRALEEVEAASPRLQSPVLLSTPGSSRGVMLVGVDPLSEPDVTRLQSKLLEGEYFKPHSTGGILIGSPLSKALGVGVGDELAVLAQGLYGSIGAAKYRVAGIYDTGNAMVDGEQVFVALEDASSLLSSDGRWTTVALRLRHHDASVALASRLGAQLSPGLEVEDWKQMLPDVAQTVAFHEWVATIVMTMLFGIVLVGVANTVLMSVFERRHEFGVMMAMGTRGFQVFRTIVYEGLLIGLLGLLLGVGLGYAVIGHLGAAGIDFSGNADAVQTLRGATSRLHPDLSFARMLQVGALLLLVTTAAAIYPALRISRLRPLQAIRGEVRDVARNLHFRFGKRTFLLALGSRNLMRHPMRTGLSGFGMMFAMAACVFLGCFVIGYYRQMVENSTGLMTGDGQVQHRDFRAALKPELMLDDSENVLDVLRRLPGIKAVSPRVESQAMVGSPRSAEPILLVGVDADLERQVTFLAKSIRVGRYLQSSTSHEIVLGRKLAERLKVGPGEKVVVMAQDVEGELVSEAFVVTGLFDTGSHGFDDTLAHVSLPTLQKMLGMGAHYSMIAFRVDDRAQLSSIVSRIRENVRSPTTKVYPWQELLPQVAQLNAMLKGALALIMGVVFVTIAMVLMNTVLMTVLERTREFGVMLALGSRPGMIVRLVMLESLLVGVAGSAVGASLGTLIAWLHSHTGVAMKAHGMAGVPGATDTVYPQLTWAATLGPAIVLPLIVAVVSLYPAVRAGRLQPILAMRSP